jgi:CheY-like chemotaxis protein
MESMFHSSSHMSLPMAGYRVLLVSDDAKVRVNLRDATHGMGLHVDSVGTIVQAVQYCEMDIPHLIVIDETLKNGMFEELRRDLLHQNINYPFIEISDKAGGFQMSGWTDGSYTSISRDTIAMHLPQALTFEMARAM